MIERYTRPEMGAVWTDERKYAAWLAVELAVCEAHARAGTIPAAALALIKAKASFNPARILEIEEQTKHDVIAFLTNVAEYVGEPARHIHLGLTSSDVLDTSLAVLMREAGNILLNDLTALRGVLARR